VLRLLSPRVEHAQHVEPRSVIHKCWGCCLRSCARHVCGSMLLQVRADATIAPPQCTALHGCRRAYYVMAKRMHPDKCQGADAVGAKERFQRICEAYQVRGVSAARTAGDGAAHVCVQSSTHGCVLREETGLRSAVAMDLVKPRCCHRAILRLCAHVTARTGLLARAGPAFGLPGAGQCGAAGALRRGRPEGAGHQLHGGAGSCLCTLDIGLG